MSRRRVTLVLPPDPSSAALARRAVRDACGDMDFDVDVALLCTSELATNSVLHARPPIEMNVLVEGSSLRVEIRDGDAAAAEPRRPVTTDTLSGRGLAIVEALATAWGSDATSDGKVTWFELDLS